MEAYFDRCRTLDGSSKPSSGRTAWTPLHVVVGQWQRRARPASDFLRRLHLRPRPVPLRVHPPPSTALPATQQPRYGHPGLWSTRSPTTIPPSTLSAPPRLPRARKGGRLSAVRVQVRASRRRGRPMARPRAPVRGPRSTLETTVRRASWTWQRGHDERRDPEGGWGQRSWRRQANELQRKGAPFIRGYSGLFVKLGGIPPRFDSHTKTKCI